MAEHPTLILAVGAIGSVGFLALSVHSCDWTWFPRGGAVMALSGFIVSVQEALKFTPARPAVICYPLSGDPTGAKNFVRFNSLGAPVFNPDFPSFGKPNLTEEEVVRARDAWAWETLHDSDDDNGDPIVQEAANPGYQMRDSGTMTASELTRLRIASIFGVLGTFIWAFGDLVPRL
jgi:hypothetical protein